MNLEEGKFIVLDLTDGMVIGGFGNLKGNLDLLKYTPEEIGQAMIENNTKEDDIRLVNSLLLLKANPYFLIFSVCTAKVFC